MGRLGNTGKSHRRRIIAPGIPATPRQLPLFRSDRRSAENRSHADERHGCSSGASRRLGHVAGTSFVKEWGYGIAGMWGNWQEEEQIPLSDSTANYVTIA